MHSVIGFGFLRIVLVKICHSRIKNYMYIYIVAIYNDVCHERVINSKCEVGTCTVHVSTYKLVPVYNVTLVIA